jgi:Zn-dependent peptidase ImmA (M78 family)/DNA-binding XRE family transcriptional regulator
MATKAFVTPKLITWARDRAGLNVDATAKKLGVSPAKLSSWEHGDTLPNLKQAIGLAHKLNIPFGYLYLNDPPRENLPLPDLRTVAGAPQRKPSPVFLDVLNDALRKQQWYREYLESQDAELINFIGKFRPDEPVSKIAVDISNTLSIDDNLRNRVTSWEQFLTELVWRSEELGVLVLRSGIVGSNTHRPLNVEEFRGFVISDALAPLVFVNSRDAKAAQIFTLAHELAHLWIGQSGISNPDYTERPSEQDNEIERQCDRIAAEVLVPGDDFVARWNESTSIDDNLDKLAHRYRVSAFVILRCAFDYGKVGRPTYRQKLREMSQSHQATGNNSGGNFYTNLLTRNSPTFTATLIVATAEGSVPYREAASLLNIASLTTLQKVETRLSQAGVASA